MTFERPAAWILSSVLLAATLAACSDEPDAKRAPSPPAKAAPAAAAGVALEPRYEATLAQGIDFTRPGFPAFLREVQGVSAPEAWGRWTDANLAPSARFRFDRPLPRAFTLELRASGLGPNAYEPVRIRAGAIERAITLGNPAQDSYRIDFAQVDGDLIEIIPPAPLLPRDVSPQNMDPRKLGVGLVSLKILN